MTQSTVDLARRRPAWLTTLDRRIVGWWGVNLAVFLHVVLFQPPLWVTYAYNGLLFAIGVGLAYYHPTIRKLLVLATVAGVVELAGDYFLVEIAESLVYPGGLPMILRSPLYMPLSWAIVTTHLGYIAVRLDQLYGRRAGVAGPPLVAMVLMGFYESGAYDAGIWEYVRAPLAMVGHAPVYIVVAEGIMFATLYYFVTRPRPAVAGVGFGLVINASYVISFYLFVLLESALMT